MSKPNFEIFCALTVWPLIIQLQRNGDGDGGGRGNYNKTIINDMYANCNRFIQIETRIITIIHVCKYLLMVGRNKHQTSMDDRSPFVFTILRKVVYF